MSKCLTMAAPKGNQFWKLRSKHGRDTLFQNADLLWDAACEYFQWCLNNPLKEIVFVGKEGRREIVPKVRAFTLQGLCIYLDCNTAYFRQFKETEAGKQQDFSTIVTRIEETIYNQKFEHAAAGLLNANIIARDLGLADKNVNETTLSVSDEVLSKLADKINS